MMSIERALLHRWYRGATDQADLNELYDTTVKLLTQPEQTKQEPKIEFRGLRSNGDSYSPEQIEESPPYDMRIHSNPSALAWATFFRECNPECNLDDDVMLGWFANAMMAMHDHIYQSTQPEQTEQDPVGIVRTIGGYPDNSTHTVELTCRHGDLKDGDLLYKAPQKREPLSGREISHGFRINPDATHAESYWAGVEYAEKAHGIGVRNSDQYKERHETFGEEL